MRCKMWGYNSILDFLPGKKNVAFTIYYTLVNMSPRGFWLGSDWLCRGFWWISLTMQGMSDSRYGDILIGTIQGILTGISLTIQQFLTDSPYRRFWWVSLTIQGFWWSHWPSRGFWWVSLTVQGILIGVTDHTGILMVSLTCRGFWWVSLTYRRFWWVSLTIQGILIGLTDHTGDSDRLLTDQTGGSDRLLTDYRGDKDKDKARYFTVA